MNLLDEVFFTWRRNKRLQKADSTIDHNEIPRFLTEVQFYLVNGFSIEIGTFLVDKNKY